LEKLPLGSTVILSFSIGLAFTLVVGGYYRFWYERDAIIVTGLLKLHVVFFYSFGVLILHCRIMYEQALQ